MVERRREDRVRMWGMAAAAVGVIVLSGCSLLPGSAPSEAEATPKSHTVVLEITGDGVKKADVTYATGADRKEEQEKHAAKLPWRETVTTTSLAGISVVAQNIGGDAGALTCTVTVDRKVRQKVTVEGEFALVACDLATVPTPTPSAG